MNIAPVHDGHEVLIFSALAEQKHQKSYDKKCITSKLLQANDINVSIMKTHDDVLIIKLELDVYIITSHFLLTLHSKHEPMILLLKPSSLITIHNLTHHMI